MLRIREIRVTRSQSLRTFNLVIEKSRRMIENVNGKWSKCLPYVFMTLAALSRWPGLFPPNFSAFYALAFCAGAFFPSNIKWWLPMATLVLTDVALDFYYHSWSSTQLFNYAAFAGILWFGTRFNPRGSFLGLLSGGILGAVFFYLITTQPPGFLTHS